MAVPVSNAVPLTGSSLIDGLLQGSAWRLSGDRVITYSFSLNDTPSGGPWSHSSLGEAVRQALRAWSNVANVTFTESGSGTEFLNSTADLAIVLTGNELEAIGAVGLGVFPSPEVADALLEGTGYSRSAYPRPEGDVFFDNYSTAYQYLSPGGFGFTLVMHEIGHALGLKHTFDTGHNGRPTFAQLGIESYNTPLHTLMTGLTPGAMPWAGHASTPMLLDILAIQQIYGANTSYNTGDSTYELTGRKVIWDAGGIDTLDGSQSNAAMTIDLRAGRFSTAPPGSPGHDMPLGPPTEVGIAYNAVIENALGTRYHDTIIGNDADNFIDGGLGFDTMRGGNGNDTYRVAQSDATDAATAFILRSAPGSLVLGAHATRSLGDVAGAFRFSVRDGNADGAPDELTVFYNGFEPQYGYGSHWNLSLGAGAGRNLLPGTYTDTRRSSDGIHALLDVYGEGRSGWSPSGTFTIHAAEYGWKGSIRTLERFSVDFDMPSLLSGTFRYNYGTGSATYEAVVELPGDGIDTVRSGISYVLADNVENLTLLEWQPLSGTGNHLDNVITGNGGANRLVGGPGNDTLIGGLGFDTAAYAGPEAAYSITSTGAITTVVGPEGSDRLLGVERLQFSDVLVRTGPPQADFNGDGRPDLLTRASNGWLLGTSMHHGTSFTTWGELSRDTDWKVQSATSDFDGDGKSDFVLRNDNGALQLIMASGGLYTGIIMATLPYGAAWRVASANSDFNGDGKSDLVVRHDSLGALELLQMDGTSYTGYMRITYPATWQLVSAQADFNGDGRSDIVMRHQSGVVELLQMDGMRYTASTYFGYPSTWQVVTADADFNGDGKSDIVMRHQSGVVELLQMDGMRYTGSTYFGYPSTWQVVTANADFNGDGKSDIVMRHQSGVVELLQMNGMRYTGSTYFGYPSTWQVVSAESDFNGDGKSDILMRHEVTGTLELQQMDGMRNTGYGYILQPASWNVVNAKSDFDADGDTDILMRNADTGALRLLFMQGMSASGSTDLLYPADWQIVPT